MKKIIIALLIVSILMMSCVVSLAASSVKTTGQCNLRTGASKSYGVICTIPKGKTIAYSGQSKKDSRGVTWYYVKYNGKTGWVSSKYAKTGSSGGSSSSSGAYVSFSGSENLRSSASKTAKVLATVPKGAKATYKGSAKKDSRGVVWYKVSYNGKTGWVSSKYSKLVGAKAKVSSSTSKSTSTSSAKKPSGAYVSLSGSVNLRSGAGKGYKVLKVVPKGAYPSYKGSAKKDSRGVTWYKVSYNGKTGWVSSKYAKLHGATASTSSSAKSTSTAKSTSSAKSTSTATTETETTTIDPFTTETTTVAPASEASTSFVATDPNELSVYMTAPTLTAVDALSMTEVPMADGEYKAMYSNGDVTIGRYDDDKIAGIMIYSMSYTFFGTKLGMNMTDVKLILEALPGTHIVEHDGHLDCGLEGDTAWNGSCASEIQYLFTNGVVSSIDWHSGHACISYE